MYDTKKEAHEKAAEVAKKVSGNNWQEQWTIEESDVLSSRWTYVLNAIGWPNVNGRLKEEIKDGTSTYALYMYVEEVASIYVTGSDPTVLLDQALDLLKVKLERLQTVCTTIEASIMHNQKDASLLVA